MHDGAHYGDIAARQGRAIVIPISPWGERSLCAVGWREFRRSSAQTARVILSAAKNLVVPAAHTV